MRTPSYIALTLLSLSLTVLSAPAPQTPNILSPVTGTGNTLSNIGNQFGNNAGQGNGNGNGNIVGVCIPFSSPNLHVCFSIQLTLDQSGNGNGNGNTAGTGNSAGNGNTVNLSPETELEAPDVTLSPTIVV